MSSLAVSGIVFACGFGGALLGMLLRSRLPDHYLSTETKEVIKLAMGIIGTMTALVLGLLIASAKSSFDAQRNGAAQLAANAIVLDRLLASYGEEARPTRELLRASVADMLRRTWPEDDPAAGSARREGWDRGALRGAVRTNLGTPAEDGRPAHPPAPGPQDRRRDRTER